MSLSVSDQVPPVGTKLIVETEANADPDVDVTGAAGTIYQIDIDNTANGDNAAYLKIYNNSSPTVGTTPPDHVLCVPVNRRRSMVIPEGLDFSHLSFACVTTGGTAGTTSPTDPVIVRMVTS